MYKQLYPNGSVVRVKRNLNRQDKYPGRNGCGHPGVNEDMMEFAGSLVTIKRMNTHGYYLIQEDDGWSWSDSMFESREFNSLLNN